MKRDVRRKRNQIKKSNAHQGRGRFAFIFVFLLGVAACLGGGLFYLNKQAPERLRAMTEWLGPLKTWASERKAHLGQNITHIKQVAQTRLDPHPQIRFEFYQTLPGMRVSVPEQVEQQAKVSVKEPVRLVSQISKPVTEALISQETVEVKSLRIFDADQLQRSLDAELVRQKYIVLLGTFKKNASAERLRQTLLSQGFLVKSIPTQIEGRTWYRVQVGPYASREQAQTAQQKLKSQRLEGVLRETN
jgi:cell division protein FtsN